MELNQRYIKLKEFQDLFENIFSKTKTQHNFFPKTKYNLSDGHILILTYLYRVKTCTASDVTKYLGITSGGGTVLTDTLLRHNLINRLRLEEDRRVVQLSLTNEGKEIVDQIIENRATAFVKLLHDLEETEIDQMLSVFRKLYKKLK
ncbi:MarR family winged helix-turn-helix transcriptional regulator [Peribacillus frigoritolerans]|uniref:MarR family winged helix-turn-helix transcriptional regulator n=1 Tax=Peribacillus frigoritolerans TaxID=450367 RepID=UPI002E21AD7D|nr:MarR family transcriptional regulator [Peribacillus frigoritolerans]MED4692004.1 MarR family transcriptional regulator [Peribacillus frigoritolerans]